MTGHSNFFLRHILLAVLIVTTQSQCYADTEVPGLLQGSHSHYLDSISLRIQKTRYNEKYSYPLATTGNSTARIALTLSKIQISNLSTIYYQIVPTFQAAATVSFYFIFINGATSKWKEIRLNFWIISTQMSEMTTGNINMVQINPLQQKTITYTSLDDPLLFKLNQGLINDPKIFISSTLGLLANFEKSSLEYNTSANVISTLIVPGHKNYTIQFKVWAGASSRISIIRFNYVLYCPSKLSKFKGHFASGIIQHLNVQRGRDLIKGRSVLPERISIFPAKYMLIGISSVKVNKLELFSLQVGFEFGNLDLIETTSLNKVERLQLNYLIVGVDMMLSCINCPDSYVLDAPNNPLCVSKKQCAAQEVPMVDKDAIYYSCRKCVANTFYLGDKKECGCKTGFTMQPDGLCKESEAYKALAECSDPNSYRDFQTNRCICLDGFYPDQFGFCGGMCDSSNSYWDLNTQACACFDGYETDYLSKKCIKKNSKCGQNQILINGKCDCDGFTVKIIKGSELTCEQCKSGSFKAEDLNECKKCNPVCVQCISEQYCLTCSSGYYFKEFKCVARCGDAIIAGSEQCDDGNLLDNDGCSMQCSVQVGYVCQKYIEGKSVCVIAKPIKSNSTTENPVTVNYNKISTSITNITNIVNIVNISNTANNSFTANQQSPTNLSSANNTKNYEMYRLGVSKSSPIYLSSGISLELLIKPAMKRSQEELNRMLRVEVSDRRAIPNMVYISQDPGNYESVRCYMHYNNVLPVVDFSIKVWARFNDNFIKTLTLYSKVSAKISRAIKPLDDDVYLQ